MPIFLSPASVVMRSPASTPAGERDHADPPVRHQRVADLGAVAGERLQNQRRQPGLHERLGELECRKRRHGRRLEDHGVARRDRGPSLCATRFSGSLNGVIASTTPIGTRW